MCRFDELPIAQLPTSHDDPRVAAGLEVVRQLDEKLRDAWIKVGSQPSKGGPKGGVRSLLGLS